MCTAHAILAARIFGNKLKIIIRLAEQWNAIRMEENDHKLMELYLKMLCNHYFKNSMHLIHDQSTKSSMADKGGKFSFT